MVCVGPSDVTLDATAGDIAPRAAGVIEGAIERLLGSLPEMSVLQRDAAVRSAIAAMNPARI